MLSDTQYRDLNGIHQSCIANTYGHSIHQRSDDTTKLTVLGAKKRNKK